MPVICKGEVHYTDGEGDTQVEEVENFPFPVRGADEKLPDFQTRVTDVVLHNTRKWIGRKVLAVKWSGPLGYHYGHAGTPSQSNYQEQPAL